MPTPSTAFPITYTMSYVSAPLLVSNFRIDSEELLSQRVSLTLAWEPPIGIDSAAIVDYYSVTITPAPLDHPEVNCVSTLSLQVTLEYNKRYTATVAAVNCVGYSATSFINDILYEHGKLHRQRDLKCQ